MYLTTSRKTCLLQAFRLVFTPSDWTRHDCTACRVYQKKVNSCRWARYSGYLTTCITGTRSELFSSIYMILHMGGGGGCWAQCVVSPVGSKDKPQFPQIVKHCPGCCSHGPPYYYIYLGRMCHENYPLDILCLNFNKCPASHHSWFETPFLGHSVAYLM